MFHQLVSAYVNVEGAERDRVYAYAGHILRTTDEPPEAVARFVVPTARAEWDKDERAHEVLESEAWNDNVGAIFSAIMIRVLLLASRSRIGC
jgi:hypothetical protein